MSESEITGRPDELPDGASPEELQADIEATRERLAATVEELAAKVDIPTQAKEKFQEASDRAAGAAHATIDRASLVSPTVWAGLLAAIGLAAVLILRARHRRH